MFLFQAMVVPLTAPDGVQEASEEGGVLLCAVKLRDALLHGVLVDAGVLLPGVDRG